jgi:hypothetical protein
MSIRIKTIHLIKKQCSLFAAPLCAAAIHLYMASSIILHVIG